MNSDTYFLYKAHHSFQSLETLDRTLALHLGANVNHEITKKKHKNVKKHGTKTDHKKDTYL